MTDAELIARVLCGDDRHAFGELVRRHQSSVRGLVRHLCGDPATADDLAQEVFVRAFRHLGSYQGGARFSTWLFRIAFNVYATEARRGRLANQRAEASRREALAEPAHELLSEGLDRRRNLERALQALRTEERAALVLTYARDVSHEEAASILGCPLGTLKTHVARAKEKIRLRLEAAHG